MLRIWKCYQNCLSLHPVKTQVISSGFLWGIGDVAAQYVTHSTAKKRLQYKDAGQEFKINWKRVAITSIFGFGFVGPVGHFWYEGLDRFIKLRLQLRPKSASVDQVKEDVKRDFLPALILEGAVWPIVQVANFRYVPVRYQLLYVNIFCLLDSAFLSWIDQQKDAPWKQQFTSFTSLKERGGQGRL
ncbi:PXMP2/4 family protein 2-like isoform X2 [Durio zibethinus]|uniref:PXMP2/4 family protein 2-like isoform X2 n=1 Tax=Durio zibethinus TaxID=66656 RepID=A0A6P5ZRH1_DURZI|nr:PXMP2/4 family protein 2-like isoform X2 [Durio zibethinus]